MNSLKQETAPQLVSVLKNWKKKFTWVVWLGFSHTDTVNVLARAAVISTLNYSWNTRPEKTDSYEWWVGVAWRPQFLTTVVWRRLYISWFECEMAPMDSCVRSFNPRASGIVLCGSFLSCPLYAFWTEKWASIHTLLLPETWATLTTMPFLPCWTRL